MVLAFISTQWRIVEIDFVVSMSSQPCDEYTATGGEHSGFCESQSLERIDLEAEAG